MTLRPAERKQLPAILRLLSAADLPTAGVGHQLGNFVVALTKDELSGPRQRAPQPIAACDEFTSLCPESAVLMAMRPADA